MNGLTEKVRNRINSHKVHLEAEVEQTATDAEVWFTLSRSDKLTDCERKALNVWLQADEQNRKEFDEAKEAYELLSLLSDEVNFRRVNKEVDTLLQSNPFSEDKNLTRFSGYKRWSIAAALVISVFIGGISSYSFFNQGNPSEFITQKGETKQYDLDDGSSIHLNTASKVEVELSENVRQAELHSGEVFFEVAHDADRPFEVVAGNTRIKVLGTKFSVHYEAGNVEVIVLEGKVEVSQSEGLISKVIGGDRRMSRQLVADEKVAHNSKSGLGRVAKANSSVEIGWLRGELVFNNEPLTKVITELNRYLVDSQVKLKDRRLAEFKVNAVFKPNDLSAIIDGLSAFFPINIKRYPNGLVELSLDD